MIKENSLKLIDESYIQNTLIDSKLLDFVERNNLWKYIGKIKIKKICATCFFIKLIKEIGETNIEAMITNCHVIDVNSFNDNSITIEINEIEKK